MKLLELFKQGVELKVTKETSSHFTAEPVDNPFKLRFTANGEDSAHGDHHDWDVEFSRDGYSHLTGTGHEFKVMNFAKAALAKFIELYKPIEMSFTALGDNRANVYEALLKRELKGYTVERRNIDMLHGKNLMSFKIFKVSS